MPQNWMHLPQMGFCLQEIGCYFLHKTQDNARSRTYVGETNLSLFRGRQRVRELERRGRRDDLGGPGGFFRVSVRGVFPLHTGARGISMQVRGLWVNE